MAVRVGLRRGRASFAAALVAMVGLGVIGGPVTSAVAGPGDSSTATARFLSGEVLGLDLDGLVSLGGASATNSGSATPVVDPAGLDVGALGLLRVTVPSGVQVPLTDVLRLGAVNQYAGAADNGVSRAASGAVSDTGAVTTGGSPAFPANASFDLRDLLGPTITSQVADLDLAFGAVTGVAAVDAALGTPPATSCTSLSDPVHCRGYSIAGGTLTVTSPAVAGVATLLTGPGGVSSKVDTAVAALSGPNGLLAQALATVTGVAGVLGSGGVTATVTTTTNAALNTILTTPITSPSGAVTVNLSTGVITANLDQLLIDSGGSGLSSLAPNTPLLTPAVLATLATQVGGLLDAVPARVGTALNTALNAAQVDISANVCVAGAPCPGNPLTAVTAEVHGTVAQVVAGTAPATVAVRVGGLTVPLAVSALLAALATPLTSTLLSLSTTAVPAVTTGVTGIVGGLTPVLRGLGAVVDVTGNVQEPTGDGGYREVALRTRLLGGTAGEVSLGLAEVGPNVAADDPVVPTVLSIDPIQGPAAGGTFVTVDGTGFVAGATTVTIGGQVVPASAVTVTAPGALSFTTPGHAPGAVDVTVINPAGSATLTAGFTYQPVPAPVIDAPAGGSTVTTPTPTFAGTGIAGTVTVSEGTVVRCTATVTGGSWSCVSAAPLVNGPHTVTAVQTDTAGNASAASVPVSFTVAVPAAITGITPDAGPVTGGGTVTLTGGGFEPGATVLVDGAPTGGVVVTGTTTITYTAPAHPVGPVDVVVVTSGGTSPPATYTYLAAPAVTSIDPTAGPVAGGQTVIVTGSGFVPGTVVTVDGTAVAPADVTVTSASSLTFVTPAHAAGPVDVTVTTPGGTSAPVGYTYLAAPTTVSLNPTSGPVAGGQTVTVTGTGFVPGANVLVDGVAVPAADVTPTTLTFVTPAHAAGPVDVVVTTPGGASAPLGYTYLAAPTAASLTPTSGPDAGGQTVTVTGAGFVAGATSVTIGGVVVGAASVTVTSATTLTFVTPAHAAGPVDVTVTTPGGTSAPVGYTYLAAPTAASLNPTSGPVTGGQTVTVTGTGFVAGATWVTVDGVLVVATVTSATTLTFATPAHPAGVVDVVATTGGGSTGALPYRYLPVPTASSLSPTAGPATGGQSVTVTGTGFVAGATSVTIGGVDVVPLVNSATSLTFTTPAHAAGPVVVTVTTLGGTSGPLAYTYLAAPTAGSLNPTSGPITGGQTVTVTGTGFVAGATSVTVDGVPTAATVTSSTTLTFATPAHPAGVVDVVATTAGGSTGALPYRYLPVPTAASLTPTSGPATGGQIVTVTGTGFVPGATSVTIGGVVVTPVVNSATALSFGTPAHPAGPVTVTVTTVGGTSGPLGYTYLAAPGATSLTPTSGPVAGGQIVTVTGSAFVPGATSVTIGGDVVTPTVNSATSLTFTTPAHAAGPVVVTVTTPGGVSTPLGYIYLAVPTTGSLDPTSGPVAGGQTVTVVGTGFVPGATTVTVDGSGVAATVISATVLTFSTPAHPAGPVDVTVTTPGGTSGPLDYDYLAGPTAASLSPTSGPAEGGQTVTLTGTGFVPGATTVTVDGIDVDATAVSDTSLTITTPPHPAGPVDVVAVTAGGSTRPLAYEYLAAPIAESLDPTSGPVVGGQTVTVTGAGFVVGATTVNVGGAPATEVTVTSPTTLTFVTPAHAAGPVDVTVTTPGGVSDPLGYTYLPAPTAAVLDPTSGPDAGGQTVIVVGTGFVPGATSVTIGGTEAAPTVVSATVLTFTTPAHVPGSVDVTVTTPGGVSDPLLYTYVASPAAADLDPVSGPVIGGQTVTVTGSGFIPGATSVTIGGAVVDATVISAAVLTISTPAHPAGPVDVTVSTVGGTSAPLGYTYLVAPTAGSLDPSSGPVAGGQTVTVTGTGFVEGGTTVSVDGVVTDTVTVTSPTTLTFTTPAHPAGVVDVVAATPGGSTGPLLYAYLSEPAITSLDPTSGPVAGGQTVVVTGSGFVPGATTVSVDGVATDTVTVTSPTTLTFITPAHPAGVVDVAVTTSGGASAALPYRYLPVPAVSSLDPISGPVVGGQTVTVTGTGFVPGATTVTIGGVSVDPTVDSATSLTFTTPAHPAGLVDVTVTTPGGTSGPLGYTYLAAPTAGSMNPTAGPVTGGQTVTVAGTGFVDGATTVTVDGVSVDPTVDSATSLSFTTPAHPAGVVDVVATTPGGSTGPLPYVYLPVPTASSLDPAAGPVAGGQIVTVTGSGFVPGATGASVDGAPVVAVLVTSATTLSFTTPAHAAGTVDVTVTTVGGSSAPLTYTYLPVPTASSLDPAAGLVTGGQTVTVTGSGFVPGSTVTIGGDPAGGVVTGPTTLTFTTPAHPAGAVSVTATTPGGTSTPALTYTYVAAPAVTGLDPVAGPVAGGQTVTVTGSGFVPGGTSVSIGGAAGAAVTVTDPTSLTFVTPAHPAGPVPVMVTTAGGTSGERTYTYQATPSVTGLAPTHGPLVGGTTVTVTGTGFTNGPVVVTFEELPVTATVVSDTSLTFVSPAGTLAGPPVNVAVGVDGATPVVAGQFSYDAPTIDASSPVVPGSSSTVTGSGWPARDQVTLQLVDGDGTDVPGVTVTVVTTASGQLPTGTQVPVPAGTALGSHQLTASDEDGNTATDAVEIVAAGPVTPGLTTLTPDHGPLAGGTTVTVTGIGFTGATTVLFGGTTIVPGAVSDTTLTFTVPAGITSGPVNVQVSNGGTAVSGPLPYTYDAPVVTATGPATGGTTTPVGGSGFGSQLPVTVVLVDGDGDPVGDPVIVTTDGDGGFTVDLPVPAVTPGGYTVVAVDGNGNSATADLTVVAATVVTPTLTLAFDRFTQGSSQIDTVFGAGFQPGIPVSLLLDGSGRELGPVTPGADGTFAQLFTVSDLTVGAHTVTATQTAADGSVLRAVVGLTVVAAAATGGGAGGGSGAGAGGSTSGGGGLAYTGSAVDGLVPIALLILLAGAFLTLGGARRRAGC